MPIRTRLPLRYLSALVAAGILSACAPASAQKPEDLASLRKEIDAIKAAQAAMQKDLEEIKTAINPPQPKAIMDAPPDMVVSTAGAPSRGPANAPIVLVEFSDYECPFCGRFVHDSYPAISREFVDTGKVRHVFRAFPLESIHKNAFKAHEAALCADSQGKFWQIHDRLFTNQRALTPADLRQHAQAVGLDMAAFTKCLDSGTMTARVRKDVDDGMQLGVQGTPLFLIGTPLPNGDVKVLKGISGAHPFAVFRQAFDDVTAGR